jgi:hypothetical protein
MRPVAKFFEAPRLCLDIDKEAGKDHPAPETDLTPDKDGAVEVEAGGRAQYAWLEAWEKQFKMEERMLCMASFWNQIDRETRLASAQRLVAILQGTAADDDSPLKGLHGAIKGGDFGALKLDTSVYDHVPRPARWLEDFSRMDGAQKVQVLALMFEVLSVEEQKLVAATFM